MLGIDGEYLAGHPKAKFWRFQEKLTKINCNKNLFCLISWICLQPFVQRGRGLLGLHCRFYYRHLFLIFHFTWNLLNLCKIYLIKFILIKKFSQYGSPKMMTSSFLGSDGAKKLLIIININWKKLIYMNKNCFQWLLVTKTMK